MANIQKNKDAALNALTIQYANADKAKTSFGYIGIAFIVVLFGSIFMNDFIKFCIYCFNEMREWYKENKNLKQANNNTNQKDEVETDRVYGEELEEKLERVYIRLLKVNKKRMKF